MMRGRLGDVGLFLFSLFFLFLPLPLRLFARHI
jgi:hypothetical protein